MKWFWLSLAVYVIGAVVMARVIFTDSVNDSISKGYSPEDARYHTLDRVMGFIIGMSVFWPVMLPATMVCLMISLPTSVERKMKKTAKQEVTRRKAMEAAKEAEQILKSEGWKV